MPYRIGDRGTHGCSGWPVLVERSPGVWALAPGGCHESRADAVRHHRALVVNVEEAARTTVGDAMDRKTLPVDIEWKAVKDSPGEVEGYASIFGNIDLDGDVVMPGAFTKAVAEFPKRTQPLPLIADHQLTTAGVVGRVTELRQDSKGLWFKAKFSSKPAAQDLRTDVIEGHIRGTSFTYTVLKAGPGMVNGKAVRQLHELKPWEVTISPFPINELAGLTAAKAGDGLDVERRMAEWDESMRQALNIPDVAARKAAVEVLVAGYPSGEQKSMISVADRQDAPATTDDAANGDSTSTPDDAYAMAFLQQHTGSPDGASDGEAKSLPEPLAVLEQERSQAEIEAAEAAVKRALGRD